MVLDSPRIDLQAALVAALGTALPLDTVMAGVDAGLDPTAGPVTVVEVPFFRQSAVSTRGVLEAQVTLHTYATEETQALQTHTRVADTLLSLTVVESNGVQAVLSRIQCTVEPSAVTVTAATEWVGALSTYTMYTRTWRS